ncbi:MAG: hypothetical protein ABSH11_13235 [Verrucomicrobiota bacterium]|jgi:hypothetical protein
MKQNKLSLFLITLASGFLLYQNAAASGYGYATFMEEFWYDASGRLADPATGAGNLWTTPRNGIVVTNDPSVPYGSLNGLTNGLVASYGDRCIIYPTNDYQDAPYEKWGNAGQYNPGTSAYPGAGTNIYITFLYKFDDSGTPLDSLGQRVVQLEKQNSGKTSAGNISYMLVHCRDTAGDGNHIQLGISKYSGNGTAYPMVTNWSAKNLKYGQTFFVVAKMAMRGNGHYPAQPGNPYETNALWINPNTNSFNGEEPLPPDAYVDDGLDDTSPTGPGRFFVDASGQSAEMDEIRIGNYWADVTPQAGQCLEPLISGSPGTNINVDASVTCFDGQGVPLNVKAIATGTTYQWQISNGLTMAWTNIPGAITRNYTTKNLWVGPDNGTKYRAIAASTCFGPPYHYATSHVATATVTAATTTPVSLIMYDNFSDLNYQNGPITTNNSMWYTATPGIVTAADGIGIEITPSPATSTLYLGYFLSNAVVSLGVTNAIKVSLPFTIGDMNSPVQNGDLRFGLWDYYDGGVRVNAWDSTATGNSARGAGVRGYLVDIDFGTNFTVNSPIDLLYRSQILDNNLAGTTGGIYTELGNGPDGQGSFTNVSSFQANTTYGLQYQVTRCNTNYTRVTVTITNAAGTNWMATSKDTNGVYYRFDAFGMWVNSLERSAQGFTLPTYEVQVIPVPWEVEAMHMAQAVRSGNDVNLTWNTWPGTDKASFAYTVQYKTNLLDTNWVSLTTNITTTAYTHTNPPNATGFYRVRYPGT